jgi:hypothetical protein
MPLQRAQALHSWTASVRVRSEDESLSLKLDVVA